VAVSDQQRRQTLIRAVAAVLVMLALAGLWWHGYKKGERTDKQRSDLVIAGIVNDANERLLKANALIKQQSDALQANAERARRDLQTERARNERRLADARATADLVRESVAEFARGQQPDNDSIPACRSDAKALGVSLDKALRSDLECRGDAEEANSSARVLLDAWPEVK
jgi:cell division protein FtsN